MLGDGTWVARYTAPADQAQPTQVVVSVVDGEEPVVAELVAPYSVAQPADGVVSKLAFVFAFRGFDESPRERVRKQDIERPYNDDSGSKRNTN